MMKVLVVLMLVCSVECVSYKQQCLGDVFDALGDIDDIKLELKCLKEKNKEQAAKLDKQEDQLKEQSVKLDNHVNQTDVGKLKKQLQEQAAKLDKQEEQLKVKLDTQQTDVGKLKKQLQEQAAKLDKQEDQLKEQSVKLDNHVNQTDVGKLKKQLQEQSVKLDNHVNQTDVGKLKKQLQEQAAKLDKQEDQLKEQSVKLDTQQTDVGKLKKQLQGEQVAFAASLYTSGAYTFGPYSGLTPLVFKHVFTNIGNAYSPVTGRFTAPRRGAYHFECHIYGRGVKQISTTLMKNSDHIFFANRYNPRNTFSDSVSHSVTLLLEAGDVVYMRQFGGTQLYDDPRHFTTFSGHMLFSM